MSVNEKKQKDGDGEREREREREGEFGGRVFVTPVKMQFRVLQMQSVWDSGHIAVLGSPRDAKEERERGNEQKEQEERKSEAKRMKAKVKREITNKQTCK